MHDEWKKRRIEEVAAAVARARRPLDDGATPEDIDIREAERFCAMQEAHHGFFVRTLAASGGELFRRARAVVDARYGGKDWEDLNAAIGELADLVGGGEIDRGSR